ncbi:YlbL family protein [Natribacillus halophilus]|uniref:endopeptidase La n=1 Tax=Natribacillus halophilus TaxID=549003 RepID=A0A1G8MDV7_9BACI|nr:PDZ domain-containing protein [Natribacillus halophilus]SDI66124.1 PDZ domain-containing protein [Natribacillus halophilus]
MSEEKKRWRLSRTWILIGIVIVLLLIYQIPMPYYYSQPGDATGLNDFITVEDGTGEEGEFYLTTIHQSQANLILYAWSFLSPYRTLTPVDAIRMEGETDEDYQNRQMHSMRQSQDAAKVSAYEAAGAEVQENGVLVTQFVDDMGANEVLDSGDVITAVDGEDIGNITELNETIADKEDGEDAALTINREGEVMDVDVEVVAFPETMDHGGSPPVGLGIEYPVNQRDFIPEVTVDAGEIGGPSAGLMFSLEIYNQLIDDDLTNGLDIAGTGSIDEEGNVGRIGGVGQKVVASDNADIDVFFAPQDTGLTDTSDYELAIETAEDIGTSMEIVPVLELRDAVDFLEQAQET